eukprot:gb/GECG01014900.1/.p1 GENE.gb/GECG01014900.1/~~gb/GECG01014900.1/.p1  ORF type:complete len:586 (+),score=109.73 gb/GECG01014900.1/:1-1758(+)
MARKEEANATKNKEAEKAKKANEPNKRQRLTPNEWLHRSITLIHKSVVERDNRGILRALRYMSHIRTYVGSDKLLEVAKSVIEDGKAFNAVHEVFSAIQEHEKSHGKYNKDWEMPEALLEAVKRYEEGGEETTQQQDGDVEMQDGSAASASVSSKDKKGQKKAEPKDKSGSSEEKKGEESAAKKKEQKPRIALIKTPKTYSPAQPEVVAYFLTLGSSILLYQRQFDKVWNFTGKTIEWITSINRRLLDIFSAKNFSQMAFVAEREGKLGSLKDYFLNAYRTACLRHDEMGQATLLNLLLRNLLQQRLYDQAQKLISLTNFPERVSNNQQVRYLFYKGKVQAVHLDYTDAYQTLLQAFRKAPATTGFGFKLQVQHVLIIVQLLLGEVPEKSSFHTKRPKEKRGLEPYFFLTQAVRIGNVTGYRNTVQKYEKRFIEDDTLSLVLRLRHNVIKTALKSIAASYSNISFEDVASKLTLQSADDAEFLCAKAIRDGVIEGSLDHETQSLRSKEVADIYCTSEPQEAFDKRIKFCLEIRNEAVKAMRYPAEAYKKEIDAMESARREAEEEEDEIMKALEDEEEGDDEDDVF